MNPFDMCRPWSSPWAARLGPVGFGSALRRVGDNRMLAMEGFCDPAYPGMSAYDLVRPASTGPTLTKTHQARVRARPDSIS